MRSDRGNELAVSIPIADMVMTLPVLFDTMARTRAKTVSSETPMTKSSRLAALLLACRHVAVVYVHENVDSRTLMF